MAAKPLAAFFLSLVLVAAGSGCRAEPDAASEGVRERSPARLGLMTTLPIYWPEATGVGELLRESAPAGWVRQALETRFAIEPLDTLDEATLKRFNRLLLAQPRALTPAENIALDAWVRRGGRLLLLADPMLTRESRFTFGDKRRPQDVILLSPILTHWGLTLTFDPEQDEEERIVAAKGVSLPVALAGTLEADRSSACEVSGAGVVAQCRIGRGMATIVADAAVLDDVPTGPADMRRHSLIALVRLALE